MKFYAKKQKSGRNNQGKITVRHRGGGHKKKIRLLDNYRNHFYIQFRISCFIYDPNRNAKIAYVQTFPKKIFSKLVIHPINIKLGQSIFDCVSNEQPFIIGYSFFVKDLPTGTFIYNVQKHPKIPGVFSRSAGTKCEIINKTANKTKIKLPSGATKEISNFCRATIGITNNLEFFLKKKVKAGENRWIGKRPTVRGLAINPVDHPHGGGEGKSRIGRIPVNPWGRLKKGKKK